MEIYEFTELEKQEIERDRIVRLRDEFAMAALTGLCADSPGLLAAVRDARSHNLNDSISDIAAAVAYEMADAMLEARKS